MTLQIRKPVLLTGAGFTRNFGGFLADQMWARVFNSEQVQRHPSLIHLLKGDFDFESVYNQVMDGNDYSPEAQTAMRQAVQSAYEQLDIAIRNYWGPHSYSGPARLIGHRAFTDFLEHFASENNFRGYIFTLNQDLFVERWYSGRHKLLRMPGIKRLRDFQHRELQPEHYIQVPREPSDVKEDTSKLLYYVKLHGSMNWTSSDGRELMVIGGDKPGQIHRERLLRCYYEIFKKVLSCQERRLLVIGYGFRDDHINAIIAESILKHNLKLYVIAPSRPKDFKESLLDTGDENKKTLWGGLVGYWDWELKDMCPANQPYFSPEINRAIFQN